MADNEAAAQFLQMIASTFPAGLFDSLGWGPS
jgi:hypothetical protein